METYDLSAKEAYEVMKYGYTVECNESYHYQIVDDSIDGIYKYRKSSGEFLSNIEFKMSELYFKVIESENRRFID